MLWAQSLSSSVTFAPTTTAPIEYLRAKRNIKSIYKQTHSPHPNLDIKLYLKPYHNPNPNLNSLENLKPEQLSP